MIDSIDSAFVPYKTSPTPEEIEQKNEKIENDFWNVMNEHPLDIDGDTKYVHTERNLNDTYCIAISDKDMVDPKIFFLVIGEKEKDFKDDFDRMNLLLPLEEMGREDLEKIYRAFEKNAQRVDAMGDPNKVSIAEMRVNVLIHDRPFIFYYMPEGIGPKEDSLKEFKRSVGRRNAFRSNGQI